MANSTARKPRPQNDPVDPTDHRRHNPDVQPGVHPGAAPLHTDVEAGRHRLRPESNDAFVVDTNGEVRAGPGDVGAQDAPRVLDDPRDQPARGKGFLLAVLIVVPALVLLFWMLAVSL